MKPVILKQHEVIHLRDNGSVIAWRAVKLQIGKGYLYSGCANAREYLGPKAFGKWGAYFGWKFIPCPYGRTREERWVRETSYGEYVTGRGWQMAYLADGDEYNNSWDRGFSWRSPILMKEAQSRFTVTLDVGVKRIQEVTEEEAKMSTNSRPSGTHLSGLWEILEQQPKGSWDRNDYFWKITCAIKK